MQGFEVEIESLTHDGKGVARVAGKALFVPGTLPGERALVRYSARHRNYDEAKLIELLSRSADRVEALCPHFGGCGGCALQHLPADKQIAVKQNVLAENFERIGKVAPREWLPALTDKSWGYRRKGRLSVKWVEKKNKALVGIPRGIRALWQTLRYAILLPEVGQRLGICLPGSVRWTETGDRAD